MSAGQADPDRALERIRRPLRNYASVGRYLGDQQLAARCEDLLLRLAEGPVTKDQRREAREIAAAARVCMERAIAGAGVVALLRPRRRKRAQ